MKYLFQIFIGASLLISFSTQKAVQFDFKVRTLSLHNKEYLTKFIFSPGEHEVVAKFGIKNRESLDSKLFNFQMVMVDRKSLKKRTRGCDLREKSLQTADFELNQNGDKTAEVKMTTPKFEKQIFVNFYIIDCDSQAIALYNKSRHRMKIRGEIVIKNNNSHFAHNETHVMNCIQFFGVLYTIVGFIMIRKFLKEYYSGNEVNRIYMMANISLFCKVLSFPLEYIHLQAFSYNGYGLEFLNFFGQSFAFMSQYLLQLTLIMVAFGWTINVNSLDEFDILLPVSLMIGFFQLVIIGIGRIAYNEENFMHRYDNFVGWLLVAFNICYYIVFVIGLIETKNTVNSKKVDRFMNSQLCYATAYFFAFPVLMFTSVFLLPIESRHDVVEFGVVFYQSIAIIVMAYCSKSRKSEYSTVVNFNMQLPTVKED